MAKILISYFSDYGEAMYDAITGVLLNNGNDVFRLNINNSDVSITRWGGESWINGENLLKRIKEFNPDIVLNFNNCLPTNCYDLLDEKCKILAVDADAPEVAFWNKDMIEQHMDRFMFLGLQSYSKTMYERYLNIQLTNKNYLYFPPATVVKNEKLKQDKNISFIGSNFYPLAIPREDDFYSEEGIKLYDAFKKNYFLTLGEAEKICKNLSCITLIHEKIRAYYVGQERLKYMQQLTDLGFTFYGVRWWNRIAYYDFDLAKCLDPTPKTSIEENQWVYNTSKISINISHPLAKSSFSWRVMDIMASNACLLMEDKPDWRDLFAKYLSQEVLDVIIYKDRFDMREKAKRLLTDEKLRLRCVKELNNAIEQNGRWEHRLINLQNFLHIPLLNLHGIGRYIRIARQENVSKRDNLSNERTIAVQKSRFARKLEKELQNIKKRVKLFCYLSILALVQIPGLDIGTHKKQRSKLFRKIHKYWR